MAVSLGEIDIAADDQGYDLLPGCYLKIEVSDTGCGIPKELLGKIFEPYFTTKKTGEGTGMGLAVVHGIVTTHKGQVTVYSEPGQSESINRAKAYAMGISEYLHKPVLGHDLLTAARKVLTRRA